MTENGSYSGGRAERTTDSRHGYSSRDYHGSEHRRDRDRGDRAERSERPDRPDRPERSERSERPERTERSDRGGRSDRGDRDRERGDRERGDRHRDRDRGDRERGDRDRDAERRRSRSPGYRSSRTSRRDHPDESASSNRYDRDRDREFGGRHADPSSRYGGRPDREWDNRERGGPRRDRDDRGGRPKQDDRGGRDPFARKRSVTPPSKKREPTPDLTDIVPITERKRRMTMWDIKPQGYENVTAEQAKLSGMFPLPGAPRQTPMDPTRLQVFINQPGNIASAAALKPTNSRQAKRLMVRNLPQNADDEELKALFNETLRGLNVIQGGSEPVTRATVSENKKIGLLEFEKTEDCTVGLAFTGIEYKGKKLEIARPKDYIVPLSDDTPQEPGNISSYVPDSPNKILVANILPTLQDAQLIDLLKTFGELKAFVLVKNSEFDQSVGIAFCEFVDPQVTDVVVDSLNNMELGDRNLRVQRASIGIKQSAGMDMNVNAMAMMAGTTSSDLEPSRVLQLLNMVTAEELLDTEEYEDIRADIKEECSKFGTVLDVKIPRPSGSNTTQSEPGVGKIYVLFKQVDAAGRGLKALAGRKFQDRTVVVTYFPEESFEVSAW